MVCDLGQSVPPAGGAVGSVVDGPHGFFELDRVGASRCEDCGVLGFSPRRYQGCGHLLSRQFLGVRTLGVVVGEAATLTAPPVRPRVGTGGVQGLFIRAEVFQAQREGLLDDGEASREGHRLMFRRLGMQ